MVKVCFHGHVLNDWHFSCPVCANEAMWKDADHRVESARKQAERKAAERESARQAKVLLQAKEAERRSQKARSEGTHDYCHGFHCGKKIKGWFATSGYVCQNPHCNSAFCHDCLKGVLFKKCPICGSKVK